MQLWSPAGELRRTLPGSESAQLAVGWSPDGTRVAAGGKDGVLRVWDAADGRLLTSLIHPDWVRSVEWSPAGDRLASSGADGISRVWNLAADEVTAQLDLGADLTGPTRWSPDGSLLAAGTVDGDLVIWDPRGGTERARTRGEPGGGAVLALSWSPDGARLVAGRQDGTVEVWAGQPS